MAEETAGERTESATPRRREKAREKGQVARSQEVNSFFVLLTGAAVLVVLSPFVLDQLRLASHYLLGQAHFLAPHDLFGVHYLLQGNLEVLLVVLLPVAGIIMIAGMAASIVQVGLKLTPSAMEFKLNRLDPVAGSKRFFQKKTFHELVKNVVKITAISLLAWAVIHWTWPELTRCSVLPLPAILDTARGGYVKLMAVLLAFLAILAVVDWIFQKQQYEKELKMSKQEVKQEYKEIEGDPQIKARIRAQQMEMARKRMLADVPRADVVITNPTHLAVALKYETGKAAPVVLAKGADHVAAKIREVARDHRVPVIENKPVARALYAEVEVGDVIPETLFQAVAEILAYVYRLKKA
ncbi:flagellar biosynthesis protein FlhB [bacterium]|nr:flagellar biosynthesis protein FlhB [bacterium]